MGAVHMCILTSEEHVGAGRGSKLGASYVAKPQRTVLNSSERTGPDLLERHFRRSGHFLIYVDTIVVFVQQT